MDIMNVYTAGNNMQVHYVRFRQKISPLFRFSFSNRSIQCKIARCCLTVFTFTLGDIQVLRNAVGGGWVSAFPDKNLYEGVQFNVLSVIRVGGGQISREKSYVTLERSLLQSDRFKAISSTKRIVGSFEHKQLRLRI